LKIRILQDTNILHNSWTGDFKFISLQEGQILDNELDKVPTVEEFQKIYDEWFKLFQQKGLV